MSRYDDPVIPADDALARSLPWYRSASGLAIICLIGVLLLGPVTLISYRAEGSAAQAGRRRGATAARSGARLRVRLLRDGCGGSLTRPPHDQLTRNEEWR